MDNEIRDYTNQIEALRITSNNTYQNLLNRFIEINKDIKEKERIIEQLKKELETLKSKK